MVSYPYPKILTRPGQSYSDFSAQIFNFCLIFEENRLFLSFFGQFWDQKLDPPIFEKILRALGMGRNAFLELRPPPPDTFAFRNRFDKRRRFYFIAYITS